MKKSDIQPLPKYFDRYIRLVDDVPLDEAFQNSLDEIEAFDWAACQCLGLQTYAPGKWAVPDILQHLLDWERILTYRALLFARDALKIAPGHDEDLLAKNAGAQARSIENLVEEMRTLRHATRLFFKNLNDEQLLKTGICWESEMSVLALGCTMLGHQRHHFNILRERYFPLL
jgi:hypothetical protein